MTDVRAESSLSSAELVVLACLAQGKEPSDDKLGNAVRLLCFPKESAALTREIAVAAVEVLQHRALVAAPRGDTTKKKQRKKKRRELTDAGRRALCTAFGLDKSPTWTAVRDQHLPALGLRLSPGSQAAVAATRNTGSTIAKLLKVDRELGSKVTPISLCDALIADALKMPPGKITLDQIRAHVLTQRSNSLKESKEKPTKLVPRVVGTLVGESEPVPLVKEALLAALGRLGLRGIQASAEARSTYIQPREPPPERAIPPMTQGPAPSSPSPVSQWSSPEGTIPPPQPAPLGADLLNEVRTAIRQIGADGRFGTEKVFVSALWHRIEGACRASLSLDGFKRWLLDANREGRLVLARADLVGAMDPRQVAESEIRDVNATFHFVLDAQRGESASRGASHVR